MQNREGDGLGSFTWLDYSERERQKALEVIGAFREESTRDELGIGVIRDAIADHLFPGTTTMQTRVKYFLFVPRIFLEIERRSIPSAEMAVQARKIQDRLRQALVAGGEKGDVIGSRSGVNIQRLPSSIYWQGLMRWGLVRKSIGSEWSYYTSIDKYYRRRSSVPAIEKGETPDPPPANWDRGLYALVPSNGWLDKTDFSLTPEEAQYLIDHIISRFPRSLLADLILRGKAIPEDTGFPWELKYVSDSEQIKTDLLHARSFSEIMHGASLLYNLILSEQIKNEKGISHYRKEMARWWNSLKSNDHAMGEFHAFQGYITIDLKARVGSSTWGFVQNWIDSVKKAPNMERMIESKANRQMIKDREYMLKGGRARIDNPRVTELWNGASGTGQLDYRWNRPVKRIINDLLNPKQEGTEDA